MKRSKWSHTKATLACSQLMSLRNTFLDTTANKEPADGSVISAAIRVHWLKYLLIFVLSTWTGSTGAPHQSRSLTLQRTWMGRAMKSIQRSLSRLYSTKSGLKFKNTRLSKDCSLSSCSWCSKSGICMMSFTTKWMDRTGTSASVSSCWISPA